jgi:hypothetical protein
MGNNVLSGISLGSRGAGRHHGDDRKGDDEEGLEVHDFSSYFLNMKCVDVTRIRIDDPDLQELERASQQRGSGASGWTRPLCTTH